VLSVRSMDRGRTLYTGVMHVALDCVCNAFEITVPSSVSKVIMPILFSCKCYKLTVPNLIL
jgi:hypothetical protein